MLGERHHENCACTKFRVGLGPAVLILRCHSFQLLHYVGGKLLVL